MTTRGPYEWRVSVERRSVFLFVGRGPDLGPAMDDLERCVEFARGVVLIPEGPAITWPDVHYRIVCEAVNEGWKETFEGTTFLAALGEILDWTLARAFGGIEA